MAEDRRCKFCGVFMNAPCVDETDLIIFSRVIDRCFDAYFNFQNGRKPRAIALTPHDGKAKP